MLSGALFAVCLVDSIVFLLYSVNMWFMLIDFSNVRPLLHLLDKFHFVMMYYPFYWYIMLDLIWQYFVKDFHIYVYEGYWFIVGVCVCVCEIYVWFCCQGNAGLSEWIGNFYLFFWLCHASYRVSVPRPGIEPGPWQWKPGILATRPPGNPHPPTFLSTVLSEIVYYKTAIIYFLNVW